jgi:hypothetical protein
MTGKWLGQQPLGHSSHQAPTWRSRSRVPAPNFQAAALCCLLLAGGGCVDIAARTAGLPFTGKTPADEVPNASVENVVEDLPTTTAALPPDPRRPAFDASPARSTSPESLAVSAASDTSDSADGFPDADKVGLGQ